MLEKMFSKNSNAIASIRRGVLQAKPSRINLSGTSVTCKQDSQSSRTFFTASRAMTSSEARTQHVSQVDDLVVPKDEVTRFIADCMRRVGTKQEDAITVAHHLMTADYRGHFSHGMNRMQMYVHDIKTRITDPTAVPEIVTDFQVIFMQIFSFILQLILKKKTNFSKFGFEIFKTSCLSNSKPNSPKQIFYTMHR